MRINPIYFNEELIGLIGITQNINERKSLEVDLNESKKLYKRLFNSVFEAIIIHDNSLIIDINESFEKLFKYKRSEILGKSLFSLIPESQHKRVEKRHKKKYERPYETLGMTKMGKLFPMIVQAKQINYKGREVRIVGIKDLSQIRSYEEKYNDKAELLRVASDITQMGGWDYHINNRKLSVTNHVRSIFEIDNYLELSLKTALDFYEDHSAKVVKTALKNLATKGEEFDLELQINSGKGNNKHIRHVGKAEKLNGKIHRLYGMIQDISRQKKMEHIQDRLTSKIKKLAEIERLMNNTNSYKELAEEVLKIIARDNKVCNFISFLVQSSDIGYAYNTVCVLKNGIGRKRKKKTFFEDEIDNMTLLKKGNKFNIKKINLQQKNTPFSKYLLMNKVEAYGCIPLVWNAQLMGFIVLGVDKTSSLDKIDFDFLLSIKSRLSRSLNRHILSQLVVKNNAQLEETILKLEEKNNDLKDFSNAVSHDLKAPLHGMIKVLDWMKEDYARDTSIDLSDNILLVRNSIDKIQKSIDGVLDVARIGSENYKKGSYSLNNLIDEAMSALILPDHVQMNIDLYLPDVYCIGVLIQQLFQNLLSNAVKYCDKGKCIIHITGIEMKDHFQIAITDNGRGLSETNQKRIFNLFTTLGGNMKSTGIGLAIARKIAQIHKGKIWVESEQGKGATFFFTIPKV